MAARLSDQDATKFSLPDAMKTYFMVQDVFMLETGTVPGYVFLVDSRACRFGHLSRFRLSYMKTYAEYLQVSVLFGYLTTHYQLHTSYSYQPNIHLTNIKNIIIIIINNFKTWVNWSVLRELMKSTCHV
jgi:hypothetical protein